MLKLGGKLSINFPPVISIIEIFRQNFSDFIFNDANFSLFIFQQESCQNALMNILKFAGLLEAYLLKDS